MSIAAYRRKISDLSWRVVPVSLIVAAASLVVASQVVNPHRRLVKITVLFLLLVAMFRLEAVYSLYLFVLLMPFPSGVALTSTNVLLMSLIPLLWVIRASSKRQTLIKRTPLDGFILFFLLAFVVSFFNSETNRELVLNLRMLWRQLAALSFFYLIVMFVDDEQKLSRFTKVVAVSASLLSLTACIELFAPQAKLIPGWISLHGKEVVGGEFGGRVQGIRVGGSVGSHGLLGDFVSLSLFYVTFHLFRARNPIENAIWLAVLVMSFTAVVATANRGAFLGLFIGIVYAFWVFRRYFNPVRFILVAAALVALFVGIHFVLDEFTYVASITDRLTATRFRGVVPDNRWGAWIPALERSFDHIFIGHGPWYDVGSGLGAKAWPHNAYIYNLYTFGLLGLSAMLLIRYRALKISVDQLRVNPPASGRGLAANMMGILHVQLVMHLLQMMRTDFERPSDDIYIYLVWMLFGLIVATAKIQHEQGKREAAGDVAAPHPIGSAFPRPSTG